jgi:3D (Asp-Asp-Asp) domain-containing protein
MRLFVRSICVALLLLCAAVAAIPSLAARFAPVDGRRFPSCVEVESPRGNETFLTFEPNLISALDAAGIELSDEDRISLPADLALVPGERYSVRIDDLHAVRLSWNGVVLTTTARDIPLTALASSAGFDPLAATGRDRIEIHPSGTAADPGAEISYVAVRSEFDTVDESVPFATVYVDDRSYRSGYTAVVQGGKDGVRRTTYESVFEDGLLRERREVGTETVRAPVSRIIRRGTSEATPLAIRSTVGTIARRYYAIRDMLVKNGSYNYKDFTDNRDGTITVDGRTFTVRSSTKRRVTAYDGVEWCAVGHRDPVRYPGCVVPREHNTFSGLPARRGIVATFAFQENGRWVATRLPMGTVVFVERYGLAVVGDIHHVTRDIDRIDCSYDPREVLETYRLGLTTRRVYILEFP